MPRRHTSPVKYADAHKLKQLPSEFLHACDMVLLAEAGGHKAEHPEATRRYSHSILEHHAKHGPPPEAVGNFFH